MFFTRFAHVIAVLALILGIWNLALGIMIATETIGPYEATLARYSSAKSSGAIIDKGIYIFLFGIVLGVLKEIRYALRT